MVENDNVVSDGLVCRLRQPALSDLIVLISLRGCADVNASLISTTATWNIRRVLIHLKFVKMPPVPMQPGMSGPSTFDKGMYIERVDFKFHN